MSSPRGGSRGPRAARPRDRETAAQDTSRPDERAFAGKWAVERLIGWGMAAPALFDRAIGRLEARGWSHTLMGVTGDFVPAREVLNPRFLAGMIW